MNIKVWIIIRLWLCYNLVHIHTICLVFLIIEITEMLTSSLHICIQFVLVLNHINTYGQLQGNLNTNINNENDGRGILPYIISSPWPVPPNDMILCQIPMSQDYKIDMDMYNKQKKKEENEQKDFDNISQFNVSMASPALTATTATTAFAAPFYSHISLNESAINDGDAILLRSSVANTYINTMHDTTSTSETLSNYDSNNDGSSNQAQYFESVQESQSQSQSQSFGTQYQQPWQSVATS